MSEISSLNLTMHLGGAENPDDDEALDVVTTLQASLKRAFKNLS